MSETAVDIVGLLEGINTRECVSYIEEQINRRVTISLSLRHTHTHTHGNPCWLGGSLVERRSLIGELSPVCTGPAADGNHLYG